MLEKIMKIFSSLNIDTITQGLLFLLLLLSVYGFIPGLALIFSPIVGLSFIAKTAYDFIVNKEKTQFV
jgi:hypothetical protein